MNKKILLPLAFGLCAAVFTACGDDSNPAGGDPNVGDSSSSVIQEQPGLESSSSEAGELNNTVSSSSVEAVAPESSAESVVLDPSVHAPETPTLSSTGVALKWTRSDAGLPSFAANVSIPVEDVDSYTYYGAELTGIDQFKYGRFEARMKMVSFPGTVSSMFLYYDNSDRLNSEPWNEIDIEVLGNNVGRWQSNLITREPDESETCSKDKAGSCKKVTSEGKHLFGFDATKDFHLYTMIWTPEYISWEIDSVEVRRDYLNEAKKQVEFMTETQSLRFNLWASASTSWVGKFTGGELVDGPQTQYIDYVRVYSYDEATKSFKKEWQDDFEGTELDKTHWTTGGWMMDLTRLSKDNVVVEGGYCKMMMSRE